MFSLANFHAFFPSQVFFFHVRQLKMLLQLHRECGYETCHFIKHWTSSLVIYGILTFSSKHEYNTLTSLLSGTE